LAEAGLTEQDVARQITGWVAALGNGGSSIESAAEISERLD
jgi:1-deoxy-D-xylulose-5-phosphate synthase